MPQCKKDGCRENATYNRRWGHKRYCEAHGHAYADKRDKALDARAKMPACKSGVSPSCSGEVNPTRWANGRRVCVFCEQEVEELRQRSEYDRRKQQRLNCATTVAELRDWISDYVLS
jgi:hypothetical protein